MKMATSKAPITILIDSPGGSVIAGMRFIQAMEIAKVRRVKLNCVVTGHAMSMGIHILAGCNNRYVFNHSLLLTHPASFFAFGSINEEKARVMADQLQFLTEFLDAKLFKTVGVSRSTYNYWYKNELVLSGAYVAKKAPDFVTVIHNISGATL